MKHAPTAAASAMGWMGVPPILDPGAAMAVTR